MEDVRIFKIENIRFLCLTGYSESNGAGVQVSRCLWILVTYRNILNWISPPLSDLFPPPLSKVEFQFLSYSYMHLIFHGTLISSMKVCWRKMAAFSEVSPIDFLFHFRKYTITNSNSYIDTHVDIINKGGWGHGVGWCRKLWTKKAVKPNIVSVWLVKATFPTLPVHIIIVLSPACIV
jgi:hypothetical protein